MYIRLCLAFALLTPLTSQTSAPVAAAAAHQYVAARQAELLEQFSALLAIPNIASDTAAIERNAAAVAALFQSAGAQVERLTVAGAPPVVFALFDTPGASGTITFYAHYDGQPVHPADWTVPPFQPAVHDGRIWARSAGDDKDAVFGFAVALRALRQAGLHPRANLRFFLEGEEEAGSPHLAEYLDKYADRLRTGGWILCDGPVHQSGAMQVSFGARGVTEVEMTVYGPNRGLHDGHYGNWAPNPIAMLTNLLASMRAPDARILIPGFYRDVRPLDQEERAAIAAMPDYDHTLEGILGLDRTEGAPRKLAEQIAAPALNIRGIQGGFVGAGAANVISSEARASLDFRLVPDQTPATVRAEVEQFVASQGYTIVSEPPDAAFRLIHPKIIRLQWGSGYPAARVAMSAPLGRQVVALERAALGGEPVVRLPILGGSIPMYLFQGPGQRTPVVGVHIANFDDNQHAANENMRLDYLWKGIGVYAALMAGLTGD
jgi:acetylornithine deacetylase/succinyl-diaminopimelate desuccinylase-like protein